MGGKMYKNCSRREWLLGTAAALPGAWLAGSRLGRAAGAPALPVAIARCKTYDAGELLPALSTMFDQLGGLGRLVAGRTVGIKINLTGETTYRLGYAPLEDTHYTHPAVIAATVHLMGRAGARRIRVLESVWATADPVEEFASQARAGLLTADELLGRYVTVVYSRTGSYEETARRLGLDRRTVKAKVDTALLARLRRAGAR